jgi:hypothetical protein
MNYFVKTIGQNTWYLVGEFLGNRMRKIGKCAIRWDRPFFFLNLSKR